MKSCLNEGEFQFDITTSQNERADVPLKFKFLLLLSTRKMQGLGLYPNCKIKLDLLSILIDLLSILKHCACGTQNAISILNIKAMCWFNTSF
jgi:hypothetical protein